MWKYLWIKVNIENKVDTKEQYWEIPFWNAFLVTV